MDVSIVQLQLGQVEWFRSTDGADEMNPWHNYSRGRWNESMADLKLSQVECIHGIITVGADELNSYHTYS